MIKVAIAEGQRLIRESLATLVNGLKGCEVVGVSATGESAIKLVKEHQPHVLLMDMLLPGFGGLEVLQRITVPRAREHGSHPGSNLGEGLSLGALEHGNHQRNLFA